MKTQQTIWHCILLFLLGCQAIAAESGTHTLYNRVDESTNSADEAEVKLVAHFPMELNSDKRSISELVANRSFKIEMARDEGEMLPGAVGNALRLDGYSTSVITTVEVKQLNERQLSMSLWCALESYPMMHVDGINHAQTIIAGNLKEDRRSGFAFTINALGEYAFELYIDGEKVSCFATEKLPTYQWVFLTAVADLDNNFVKLYRDNRQVGRKTFKRNSIDLGTRPFIIGRSFEEMKMGPFRLNTINGLIDDIRLYAGALPIAEKSPRPEHAADLSIPAVRFENEIQRPTFHGMPAANWTNEPHGLIYYNNRYHLFFQKNGAGPYWGRIHWGHIVSDDLLEWREERVAIAPTEAYDIKGIWSGCLFQDEELTGGKPHIYYSAADYAKVSIAEAMPTDEALIGWEKRTDNPVIAQRPEGLSDDFRDPFIFKANGNYYMIVGTGKQGRGATTLHRYDRQTKSWSNNGDIFYQARSKDYGVFFEMPIVVQMDEERWLFAATPLGGKVGVELLYWVGTIQADGSFLPFSHQPKEVELSNMSKDGFGLLSPSVMKKDDKTVVIGIVPDKLGGDDNSRLGWAHTFSLPRQWSLDGDNELIQQPYNELKALREKAKATFSQQNINLRDQQSLESVRGMEIEVEAEFEVNGDSDQSFGLLLRQRDERAIRISYTPSRNLFAVDARSTDRLVNDGWLYNGLYESELPHPIERGELLKMHVFMDHSILDLFINDRWAFSVRLFPTDTEAIGTALFAEGGATRVRSCNAWSFDADTQSGISLLQPSTDNMELYFEGDTLHVNYPCDFARVTVYDQSGRLVASQIATEGKSRIRLPFMQLYYVQLTTRNGSITKKIINA